MILNHGNAGTVEAYKYRDEDLTSMRTLYDTNYFSMVHMTNVAMPYLLKSQGRVATVSSVGGKGNQQISAYSDFLCKNLLPLILL